MGADLTGKVALVTGSSSGIGEASARRLAEAGARIVVNSVRSVKAGESLAASLPDAIYVQADVADDADGRRLVDATIEHFGQLDILVNNAGTTEVIPHHELEAATTDIWRRIFEVNVFGTWALTVAAMPHLKASGDGVVVNITSLAGVRPTGSSIPYACSKAALNHMTSLLANVCGPQVRVVAVAPGLVDTPWTADWDAAREFISQTAPLGRSGQPDDIAHVVLGVVGAKYMTGQVVVVDGGFGLK